MNMEFFRLLKNILNIRKRDCFLIEYFLRGTIVDQASVVGYGIGLLLNACQLFYIRQGGSQGASGRDYSYVPLACGIIDGLQLLRSYFILPGLDSTV